jgi:hypothetical protein
LQEPGQNERAQAWRLPAECVHFSDQSELVALEKVAGEGDERIQRLWAVGSALHGCFDDIGKPETMPGFTKQTPFLSVFSAEAVEVD